VIGEFDEVVIALPVSTARLLLAASSLPVTAIAQVQTKRIWSVAFAWSAHARAQWQAGAWRGRLLDLAIKESSKPDRLPGEHWVAYLSAEASAEFSVAADVVDAARDELGGLIDALGEVEARAQRWDDGAITKPLGQRTLRVGDVVLCGDWLTGGTVEDAWLSGVAAAEAIRQRL
jgi:hypothetical protein